MGAREDQLVIDAIARVVRSQGWEVLATDRSGPTLRVTIETPKQADPQTAIGLGKVRVG